MIYADNAGAPGALIAVTNQITVPANAAPGWFDFSFASSPNLPAGNYWLGYWFGGTASVYYDTIANAGRYISASYSAAGNPSANFGGGTASSIALSLYATVGAGTPPPVNTLLPAISGDPDPGPDAEHHRRGLDGQPDQLRLPVEGLR